MSREFTGLFLSEKLPPSSAAVMLQGPVEAYQTQTVSYTITNYDTYSDYTFSGPFVNVQYNNETVTLTIARNAPTGLTEFTVTKDDNVRTLSLNIDEAYTVAPTLVGFEDDVINDVRPMLNIDGFATSPADIDTHVATDWEIATDETFQNLVWSLNNTTSDLLTTTIDTDLPTDVPLFFRSRFRGAMLGGGRWSVTKAFEVAGVVKPTVTLSGALIGGVRITRGFTINGSVYSGPGTHAASRWRVLDTLGNVVHDSGEVIGAKLLTYTPINEGFTPLPNTDYFVDVRYKSSTNIWSRVSDPMNALVANGRTTSYNTSFQRQTGIPNTIMVHECNTNPNPSYYHCHYVGGSDSQAVYICNPNSPTPPSGSHVGSVRMTYVGGVLYAASAYDQGFNIPMHFVSAMGQPRLCTTVQRITYNYTQTSVSQPTQRYTEY